MLEGCCPEPRQPEANQNSWSFLVNPAQRLRKFLKSVQKALIDLSKSVENQAQSFEQFVILLKRDCLSEIRVWLLAGNTWTVWRENLPGAVVK